MVNWNSWKGCCEYNKFCNGCKVIKKGMTKYVFSIDEYDLPLHTLGQNDLTLKYPSNTVFNVCPLSDFFLEMSDNCRNRFWNIMKIRYDCLFVICTKRIDRIKHCLPDDWGDGWNNIIFSLTVSTQIELDKAMNLVKSLPLKHLWIAAVPLKEQLNLKPVKTLAQLEYVYSGGDAFGDYITDFAWHSDLAKQCSEMELGYTFLSTGALFNIGEKTYTIPKVKQHEQAFRAGIDVSKTVLKKTYRGMPFEFDGLRWKIIQGMLIPLDTKTCEMKYDLMAHSKLLLTNGKPTEISWKDLSK